MQKYLRLVRELVDATLVPEPAPNESAAAVKSTIPVRFTYLGWNAASAVRRRRRGTADHEKRRMAES